MSAGIEKHLENISFWVFFIFICMVVQTCDTCAAKPSEVVCQQVARLYHHVADEEPPR
jgi:hypothetical protein